MRWRLLLAFVALAVSLTAAGATSTTTNTFSVQLTISASCVISSASNLTFAPSGVLATAINQTSTLQIQCTNTTPYNIGLNAGTATGATVTSRKMTSGSNTISYSLFSNPGMTTNWGETVGIDTVASTGTGATQSFTVYGQVPAQSTPAPGSYSDTVTVTVTY
jgi:spore coat protein U-like protein